MSVLEQRQITLRDPKEIQRAHDILVAWRLGEIPDIYPNAEAALVARATLDVLCWVLQHDHNDTFSIHLQELADLFKEIGLQVIDTGSLKVPRTQ